MKKIKLIKGKKYGICSCGFSNMLPFCDNAHRAFNKKNNTTYKSVKVIYNGDNEIQVNSSNWKNK